MCPNGRDMLLTERDIPLKGRDMLLTGRDILLTERDMPLTGRDMFCERDILPDGKAICP